MDNNTAQNSPIQYPDLGQNVSNPSTIGDVNSSSISNTQPPTPINLNTPPVSNPIPQDIPTAQPQIQPDTQAQQTNPLQDSVASTQVAPEPSVDLKNIQEALPINDPNDDRKLKGVVENELKDIIPGEKRPKALKREPKKNNLAQPIDDAQSPVEVPLMSSGTEKIDELLRYAIQHNASDLHLTVGYPPIVRIDGQLREISESVLTPEQTEALILPILSDEKKELLEVNREVDLAYFHEGEYSARFRINAYYTMKSIAAAFRLIPAKIRTIDELYLPKIYHRFAQLQQGFILVTGPTGHGKSTTLAAILEEINRNRFVHIVTIEDPIEYVFDGKKSLIDQREMNDDTHSWPTALRSALRQDPDVILVGEMRDYETIASAITLAETGHLVFATLHTNNAAQTVDRIIDVFPENQQAQIRLQLSNILEAVVAQRLIPLDKGGRRAVCEIMIANPAVKNMIRESKTHQVDNVIRTSADIGMVTLEKSLVDLVREGVISVQKAQEYAVFPEEVLRLLKS